MLQELTSQQSKYTGAIQINIRTTTANTIVYRVPKGRVFIGKVSSDSINTTLINGVIISMYGSGSTANVISAMTVTDITLVEGSTVSQNTANTLEILGVEYAI